MYSSLRPIKTWQTVSRRYQTTCKRRGAYYRRTPIPRSKAWLLLMHDSRAYQCDIECEVSTQYVFVTRVCRVRMMTCLTQNKASHHLCDECLLPATRQSTALMIAEVDFSKLWQFIFLPHLNYFVVVALHCTHTHDIEPLPRITVFGSLPQSIYQFKLKICVNGWIEDLLLDLSLWSLEENAHKSTLF